MNLKLRISISAGMEARGTTQAVPKSSGSGTETQGTTNAVPKN